MLNKLKHSTWILVVAFIALAGGEDKLPLVDDVHHRLLGQQPPGDMVFIPGEGEMRSFFVSTAEETNKNWLTYVKWLEKVYATDYPQIAIDARPNYTVFPNKFMMNDPYVNGYLTHPAYAYYPVVGVSWVQILEYMAWKTDRLNEFYLIQDGFFAFDGSQRNDDHFNLEAFLNEQYQPHMLKECSDVNPWKQFRNPDLEDGIFLPGYRLPTESEWEYICKKGHTKNSEKRSKFKIKKDNRLAGQGFFLQPQYEFLLDEKFNSKYAPTKYKIDLDIVPEGLDMPLNYDLSQHQVLFLKGNVREWMLDKYSTKWDSEKLEYTQIMYANGFEKSGDEIYEDGWGPLKTKEIDGSMNFRIMGLDRKGHPLRMKKYKSKGNIKRLIKGDSATRSWAENRSGMLETESTGDVGFRCVLPYISVPKQNFPKGKS